MTAQVPEVLIHRGNRLDMAECPLGTYLARLKKGKRPELVWSSTACWRGYVGTWEIRDSMLCLVKLEANLQVGDRWVMADMDRTLPWAKGCLRATWLSTLLRCPEGRLLQYSHHGFASVYERDRWFGIVKGRVEAEFVTVNPPPPLQYRIDAEGQRRCIRDFRDEDGQPDPLEGRPLSDAYLVWGKKPEAWSEDEDGYVLGGAYTRSGPAVMP